MSHHNSEDIIEEKTTYVCIRHETVVTWEACRCMVHTGPVGRVLLISTMRNPVGKRIYYRNISTVQYRMYSSDKNTMGRIL